MLISFAKLNPKQEGTKIVEKSKLKKLYGMYLAEVSYLRFKFRCPMEEILHMEGNVAFSIWTNVLFSLFEPQSFY